MKGITDFIVQIDFPYHEKHKTENGTEFFLDKRWSANMLANTKAKIYSLPLAESSGLKEGDEIIIDPTLLFEQNYFLMHGNQESVFLVDKENSLYKIKPSMILLYRESENHEWVGYLENILCKPIEVSNTEVKSSVIFIPEVAKPKHEENLFEVCFCSENSEVEKGDKIILSDKDLFVELYVEGKKFYWVREQNVIAKAA